MKALCKGRLRTKRTATPGPTRPGSRSGRLAENNAQQVSRVRQILEGLGLEIATPDDAREILQLKGGNRVNF